MAVPKKRNTKSRRDKKRMHLFIKSPSLVTCSKCGKKTRPHIACPFCGFYKGREVLDILGKLTRKDKKAKEKEMEQVSRQKNLSMEELSKK